MTLTLNPGLEGVIAAETRLSHVDGLAGELLIAGYPVEEIAGRATFEEMLYLLWHDHLPNAAALAAFDAHLKARRAVPAYVLALLEAAAGQRVPLMDALRMGLAALSPQAEGLPQQEHEALTMIAAAPTLVAAYWRYLQGAAPVVPEESLSHAANYLYMLDGARPSAARVRGLESYLNTVIDHGTNASTFTARVIISTESDMVSAIVGAVGALKGPAHGGAPGPALDMVFEIGSADNAEALLRRKLAAGERLMGFGHRVYKVRDPRADVLGAAAAQFYRADGDLALYELALAVEETALRLLEEFKPGRRLQTNVEYYTALLLHGLGLPSDLFTPTFAISRVGGWTAHAFEQMRHNRIIRPASAYVGAQGRQWQPLEER